MSTTTDAVDAPPLPHRRPADDRGWKVAMAAALLFLAGAAGFWWGTASGRAPSDADTGFLRDMIVHHDQAVQMSLAVLDGDLPPAVRTFAQDVVVGQRYEIGLMEGILRGWSEGREGDGEAMGWMGHAVPVEEMPGLASEAEMDALAAADGERAAAMWLAMMTEHHLAGAEMAEAAARRAEDDFVAEIAARMADNQRLEVLEYEAVRGRLGLADLGAGDMTAADGGHHS